MRDREAILAPLTRGTSFDLLVIGGGATGCGVALDAATRGLKVALVEKGDFASGTSGRSSKLIHGGLRYLERAVLSLDRVDLNLVRDALRERGILLRIAPHLCHPLPLVVPAYRYGEMLYLLAGLKLYDLLAGRESLGASKVLGPTEVTQLVPMLRREGLKGGVLYYDGQFDDARMNVALALTAMEHGAAVANYLEVVEFLKKNGRVVGARVRDFFSGRLHEVIARCIVNASGPYADVVCRLDDPEVEPLLQPSLGSHIVLPGALTPKGTGITIPRTTDGRVLFVLPWHGTTLVGTTDRPASVDVQPEAGEEDVEYLLRHLDRYFHFEPEQIKVFASWAGLRPLVGDPSTHETSKLHRDHLISSSPSGLITITGGKWTTYRKMSQDTVDFAVKFAGLAGAGECRTERVILHGGEGLDEGAAVSLVKRYGLEDDIASHLRGCYGDRAGEVADLSRGVLSERLVAGHPYLKGEVIYAIREELALRPLDLLSRRIGLTFLDKRAATEAAPVVLKLMARELAWTEERLNHEKHELPLLHDA